MQVIAAAAAVDGWDHAALSREELNDHDVGQILLKWRLNNVLNGQTSWTAVLPTNATGPLEIP